MNKSIKIKLNNVITIIFPLINFVSWASFVHCFWPFFDNFEIFKISFYGYNFWFTQVKLIVHIPKSKLGFVEDTMKKRFFQKYTLYLSQCSIKLVYFIFRTRYFIVWKFTISRSSSTWQTDSFVKDFRFFPIEAQRWRVSIVSGDSDYLCVY